MMEALPWFEWTHRPVLLVGGCGPTVASGPASPRPCRSRRSRGRIRGSTARLLGYQPVGIRPRKTGALQRPACRRGRRASALLRPRLTKRRPSCNGQRVRRAAEERARERLDGDVPHDAVALDVDHRHGVAVGVRDEEAAPSSSSAVGCRPTSIVFTRGAGGEIHHGHGAGARDARAAIGHDRRAARVVREIAQRARRPPWLLT